MTAPAIDRADLVAAALEQRGGAPALYRFDSTGPIAPDAFAAGSGGKLVKSVPIFREGTFRGGAFTADAHDVDALVERFHTLRDSGVFDPPVRIDHGMSARDVVGWFDDVAAVDLPDPSDGGRVKRYLTADLRIVDAECYEGLRSGKYRNRSVEVGPYETNSGDVLSLVLWGVAFVDIPAVEGLGPIKLGRRDGDPATLTVLTTEGPDTMPDTPDTMPDEHDPAVDPALDAAPSGTADVPAEDAGVPADDPAVGDGGTVEVEVVGTPTGEQDGDTATPADEGTIRGDGGEHGAPVDLAAVRRLVEAGAARGMTREQTLEALGMGDLVAELAAARRAALDHELAELSARGLVVPATRPALEALLGHDRQDVREQTRALLSVLRAPVTPGDTPDLTPAPTLYAVDGPRGTSDEHTPRIDLGMTAEEVGDVWQSATPAQRAPGSDLSRQLDAWRDAAR